MIHGTNLNFLSSLVFCGLLDVPLPVFKLAMCSFILLALATCNNLKANYKKTYHPCAPCIYVAFSLIHFDKVVLNLQNLRSPDRIYIHIYIYLYTCPSIRSFTCSGWRTASWYPTLSPTTQRHLDKYIYIYRLYSHSHI